MGSIVVGLIFILFDFNLTMNDSMILGLLPQFVGYILLHKGVCELEQDNGLPPVFETLKSIIRFMIVFTLVTYLSDMFGIAAKMDLSSHAVGIAVLFVISMITIALQAKVIFGVIDVIKAIELNTDKDLNSAKLYGSYKSLFTVVLLFNILIYVPYIMVICLALSFVIVVLSVLVVYQFFIARSWYKMPQ